MLGVFFTIGRVEREEIAVLVCGEVRTDYSLWQSDDPDEPRSLLYLGLISEAQARDVVIEYLKKPTARWRASPAEADEAGRLLMEAKEQLARRPGRR